MCHLTLASDRVADEVVRYGWNPDLDIPSALRIVPADLRPPCALVTVVDSSSDVRGIASLAPPLEEMATSYRYVEQALAIPVTVLLRLTHDYDFFQGFDEVWLCDDVPSIVKPTELRLTSDVRLGSEPPPGAAEWMQLCGCVAGLGDGIGLNYVTTDEWFASRWQDLTANE
jgi:hypothetical protein